MSVPCGKCIGCRTQRAMQWGDRCAAEARRWRYNTFCTLTYDDDHLPRGGHLDPRGIQLFMKRLRKAAESNTTILRDRPHGIRFFAGGEYGEVRTRRPHYHLVLFNCDFADKVRVGGTEQAPRYTSELLGSIWGQGMNDLGPFTPAGATYIAKYAMKKWRIQWDSDDGYADEDGEWHPRPPPFGRMSLRPGIGTDWLRQNARDLRDGFLVNTKGCKTGIPRTWLQRLKREHPELYEEIEHKREKQRRRVPIENHHPRRREAQETIQTQQHEAAERKRTL